MKSAVIESYVNVDDIAVFENVFVRYPMADDFVDRGANGFREVAVI